MARLARKQFKKAMLDRIDRSFRTLNNRRFTTSKRGFYDETPADTLNLHIRDVWTAVDIPTDPAKAILTGSGFLGATTESIAIKYTDFMLTPDPLYPEQAFFFISGSGFMAGTGSFGDASASYFQGDFISERFGAGYEATLRDGSNIVIPASSSDGEEQWVFDYHTGVLSNIQFDLSPFLLPFKITVFQYVSTKLDEALDLGDFVLPDCT